MNGKPDDRVRPAPQERFAPAEDVFDLNTAAENLREEPSRTAQTHGHRQIALFRHGPMTLALYVFERGGKLPDHVVDGPVVIHCLEGRLSVATAQQRHDLAAGTLLRLAPGVRHDVVADEPARMLLIIALQGPGSHSDDRDM